jgi:type IV pilus assembly protein PilY1
MWRFDLFPASARDGTGTDPFKRGTGGISDSASNATDFAISYGGKPIYSAKDSRASGATGQTIMAAPSLVRHPTTLGYLVIFGTGKYFETTDGNVDSTRAQSLYGIWDRKTRAQSTSAPSTALARTNLVSQTITEEATSNPFAANTNVEGIRTVSQNSIQWYTTGATDTSDSSVSKWGWVLDLKIDGSSTLSGEMMVNPMATRGTTLLANTLTPNADPCKEGVDSWIYGLDPYTGGRTRYNVFDLNNDKTINDSDTYGSGNNVVSGYKKPGAGGFTTNNGEIYTSPGLGSGMMYSSGPTSTGRQTWRVIPEEAR